MERHGRGVDTPPYGRMARFRGAVGLPAKSHRLKLTGGGRGRGCRHGKPGNCLSPMVWNLLGFAIRPPLQTHFSKPEPACLPGGKNSLNSHRLHSRTLANHFAKVSRWVRARPAATPGKETPNACPWDRGLIAGCQFRHSWEDVTGAQGDDGVAKMSERKWQSRA